MAFLVILLTIFILSGSGRCQETNNDDTEKEFEKEFGIKYFSKDDAAEAAKELEDSENQINKHNQKFLDGNSTFFEALNPLSNLPDDEFEKQKTGLIDPKLRFGLNRKPEHLWTTDDELLEFYSRKTSRAAAPTEFDSTAKGWVTAVKNQLSCGSCAAFAGTSVIETCMLKAGARFDGLDLSEQFVLNCGYNGQSMGGCNGAYPGAYVKWYGSSFDKGQGPHELIYPYQNANPSLTCPAPSSIPIFNAGAKVASTAGDDFCTEDKLMQLVYQYGAVETAIYAGDDSLQNYKYGVFQGCTSTKISHAVTVVGYGTENGVPFWKVKNSWGATWGNQGYIKIRRGFNECGIGSVCTVATCAATSDPLSAIPAPPPPPPSCDLSKYFGTTLNGRIDMRYNGIDSKLNCNNSICTPVVAITTNVCVYICGQTSC